MSRIRLGDINCIYCHCGHKKGHWDHFLYRDCHYGCLPSDSRALELLLSTEGRQMQVRRKEEEEKIKQILWI